MSVNEKMTAIADAIRGKTGKTEELTLDQMATEIAGITSGGGGGLSVLVNETLVLATDLTTTNASANVYQSDKIANNNWYFAIIEKINPALTPDTYEGIATYRLNGFNANMIRWNKTSYSAAHYNTYLRIDENGMVSLSCQGGNTLPWLAGEYKLIITG